jgi:hypothetical protein
MEEMLGNGALVSRVTKSCPELYQSAFLLYPIANFY